MLLLQLCMSLTNWLIMGLRYTGTVCIIYHPDDLVDMIACLVFCLNLYLRKIIGVRQLNTNDADGVNGMMRPAFLILYLLNLARRNAMSDSWG